MGIMNAHLYKGHKIGQRVKPVLITGKGRTKQEFSQECDVNYIVRRYQATGQMPDVFKTVAPVFADVSRIGDYAEVLRRVDASKDAFMMLHPTLRARFHNDPVELVEFVHDDRNREEAIKLGLLPAPKVEAKGDSPKPDKPADQPAK